MGSFIAHTSTEIESMLQFLGMDSLEDLFDSIPGHLRVSGGLNLPCGMSEADVLESFEVMSAKNLPVGKQLICFAGGGAYDHEIPSSCRALGSLSEFVTAYTPYQPEVAQGVLQALFEFQTLISRISGLPVSNASLYDGATALVEAINLARGSTKRSKVLISRAINPNYIDTVKTFAKGTMMQVELLDLKDDLRSEMESVYRDDVAALVVGYPNYLGVIEDLEVARRVADRLGALLVVVYDPVAIGLLRSPGEMGADVAVAEGQSLGIPLSFGGPYLGLFSTRSEFLRLVPGRLVGQTKDLDGKKAYVTTLRTREQDIRREKASSNVCTNQTLMAIQASIYLSWIGKTGFYDLAKRCLSGTRYLADLMTAIPGVQVLSGRDFVREFAYRTSLAPEVVVERLMDEGFLGGVPSSRYLEGTPAQGTVIVSVTEKRTANEIERFADALKKVVSQ